MSFDLEQRQTAALQEMLQLRKPQNSAFGGPRGPLSGGPQQPGGGPWKVLIFDEAAKDILAPLMTVGVLRRHGVTLPLSLGAPRSSILEAPAVYLIGSSSKNLELILKDLKNKIYSFFYFNFISQVPTPFLQALAEGAAKATQQSHCDNSRRRGSGPDDEGL
ncbi:hypothetical protein ETH_00042965 [Eimeria tenella]|uniref:Sec1 family domain-containing protein n=1 Tax=Eimeria tenella TaxID=5802 RepID=U6KTK9_EIMTE|nr:hypothetical protein ETH_00042965 [Eimeria tenella]CDJ38840.1 hypothetical protein ETH_00042965 [Eimeria tenella]|eukprot:XP_013229596.1 hypothetical protein ETH_00042965 [Eimeria tenella]